MSDLKIMSFSELHSEVCKLRLEGGWSFRGQSDSSWQLIPKAGRYDLQNNKNKEDITDEDAFIYWKFCASEHMRNIPGDNWEWLAIAQHHGLATRLLDWSYNPLVAAFFAVRERSDTDGLIAAAKFENHARYNECDPMKFKGIGRFAVKRVVSRIARQAGVFTIHGPPTLAVDEYGTDYELRRFIISKEYKEELLRELEHYFIHEASLFPDLDGLSTYVNWKYKNQLNWYQRKGMFKNA